MKLRWALLAWAALGAAVELPLVNADAGAGAAACPAAGQAATAPCPQPPPPPPPSPFQVILVGGGILGSLLVLPRR
jgi:hypothetical protein